MAQQLTPTEVNRAVTLREEGHSQLYVPKHLGVVEDTVWKLWKRYRKTGTVTRRAGTGPKSKTTAGDCKPFEIAHILRGICKNI
jgi:transposase